MQLHDLYLIVIAFFTEVLGTLSGIGSSTFFVPLASLFESFNLVLALTALLHCVGNISKIRLFKHNLPWSWVMKLAVPSIIFSGLGALLVNYFSTDILKKILGVVLILISLVLLLLRRRKFSIPLKFAIALSGLSGFLTGLVGTGGAIRGVVLTSLRIEKSAFIAVSSLIDLGGDLLRAGVYLSMGFMDWQQWYYIPTLALAAWLGAWSGKKILHFIPQTSFERIVAAFVFLSGIMMVLGYS